MDLGNFGLNSCFLSLYKAQKAKAVERGGRHWKAVCAHTPPFRERRDEVLGTRSAGAVNQR